MPAGRARLFERVEPATQECDHRVDRRCKVGGALRFRARAASSLFERGWRGLVGVQSGPIDAFIPVMVFAIVFGLSMDYEVFLVSLHEEWQHRGDASAAVREGLANTGRVITAAAGVMVVVFASFAAGDDRVLKLFGVAMATAVFLDAIVIRSILMPAVLELFGRRTWAFPSWADRRLPRLAIEPVTPPAPALEEAA